MDGVTYLGAADLAAALSPAAAAQAITAALRAGLDPAAGPPRTVTDLARGQLLLMPAESSASVGLKTVTVAPGNARRGLPRIHGVYLLFDADTLRPTAVLDGTALTTLRTPAVSVAAVAAALERFDRPLELVVFGAGPQAVSHVRAFAGSPAGVGRVTHAVRDARRARDHFGPEAQVVDAGGPQVGARLRAADVVVCATTARTPLLDAGDVRDGAVIVAVGSHEPAARELGGALLAGADVVVEDVGTALREAGDVIMAVEAGHIAADRLLPMAEVVGGRHALDPGRTLVFKSTGMAWEDLVVAEAVVRAASGR